MKPGMNTAEFAWLARWTGRSWTERLMLALLCTAPLVWLLAGTASTWLFDVDEGAFSEATREMIVSGDWGHTTLQGVNRFDKPIGVYWLQAASVQIFGLHEWALRLPSVLACWISALALGRFAWQLWGLPAGFMTVLIHSTSIGPWVMAHAATADAVLGMWLVLSALDLCRFLMDSKPVHLRRVALWTGLGMLTKGPVAILIPAATLLLWCLQQRSAKALLASLRDGPAWLIFLAVCLPWYSYALWRHGDEFIQGFFVRHNLSRFDGAMEGHSGAWFYYLAVAPLLWMPWSPLLLGMGRKITSFWADPVLRFALMWSGFVLVFFSASSTKLPHYALYAAPGLTLLLVQACIRSSKRAWTVGFVILMAWLALCTALPGVLQQSAHWVRDAHYQNLLRSADALNQPLAFVLCGLGLLLSCWLLFVSRARHAALGYALAAVVSCMMLGSVVMPWWSQTLQGPVRQLALASRDLPGPVVQWGGHWPSFALYREQMAPRRAPAPGEMALVRFPSNTVPAHWPVIASARGMAIVQRPLTEPAQSR